MILSTKLIAVCIFFYFSWVFVFLGCLADINVEALKTKGVKIHPALISIFTGVV
jgi:hypothetical protein